MTPIILALPVMQVAHVVAMVFHSPRLSHPCVLEALVAHGVSLERNPKGALGWHKLLVLVSSCC